jgi:hypothetical protein
MDARTYFLLLHDEAHWTGKARRIAELPTPAQWRTILPGHNSIAWCVWHIAAGEDWGIAALRGGEQVMTRDGWATRLGWSWPTFGAQMSAGEVAEMSAAIDLDALLAYHQAVYDDTRRFAADFDFDALEAPLEPSVARHAVDLLGGDAFMRGWIASWTTARDYLNTMAIMDVYYHFDEADHVLRQLMPAHRFA